MGLIFIGIALLAILVTAVAEYRRNQDATARRAAFSKSGHKKNNRKV